MIRAGVLALMLAGAAAARAAAQVDTTLRRGRPPTPRDTTAAADTTHSADTTAADTLPALLPTFAAQIAPGPLPRGARYTFTADSLLLSNAQTLSDLLGHIPGVYVARGGWYGQAEPVIYGGRGPLALEVYWDGVPWVPIGRDSIHVDPARISLAPLARVDVVVLPAALKVYLVTARPRSTTPITQIGITTGDQNITGYRVGYATRSRSGLGISLLWDENGLDADAAATTTAFNSTDIWLKAEYVPPGGRLGASFQLLSSGWRRHAEPGRVDDWEQQRRDRLFAFFAASRDDGLGFRLAGTMASSALDGDTAVRDRTLHHASLEADYGWPRASVGVVGRFGFAGTPTFLEARGGWMPVRGVTLAATARRARYTRDRSGARAHLTAGVALPLGVSARGEVAWMRDVQAPLLATDTTRQEATDVAGWLRWEHPRVVIEVGRGWRDPFTPLGFAEGIALVDHLGPTPRTEFVAAHATIRPLPGVALSGWYFDPLVGGGDFEPPYHARLSATFHSKFWRVFRSGIFTLRGEVAMESWSGAPGGRDNLDGQLTLGGASFVETNVEIQLVGVTIFWITRNANNMRASYVPGLGYPRTIRVYGARWFFSN